MKKPRRLGLAFDALSCKRGPRRRVWVAMLAVASGALGVAALACGANPDSAAHKRDCAHLFGSFSVGHWPPACWRPYGPRSPFNVPIPRNPRLAPDSQAIAAYMRSRDWSFEADGSGNFILDNGGSRPVYWSQSSDPLVKVICHESSSCPHDLQIHIPQGAQPENQWDGHMTVVDQARGVEWDFWRASAPKDGEMTVSAARGIPIGVESGTGLGGAAEAADLGLLGGLIRAPELAAGRIEHALAITAECVQSHDVWPSPAWGRGDLVCPANGAGPHFGSLLQLNMSEAEIAATRAPAWQQTIMLAMARYGIYVVDTNGSLGDREMSLLVEDDQSFTSFGYPGQMSSFIESRTRANQLVGVPIDTARLRVIAPCVPRRTC